MFIGMVQVSNHNTDFFVCVCDAVVAVFMIIQESKNEIFLKEKIIYDFLFLSTLLITAQNVAQLVGHPDFF